VHVLDSHAELLAASGDDGFIRWDVPDPLAGPAFALRSAVAGIRYTGRRGRQLFCLGGARDVADLLVHILDGARGGPLNGVSVPQACFAEVSSRVSLGAGNDWAWMSTGTPPAPVRREDEVVRLREGDRQAVEDLLTTDNPGTDALPWAEGRRWLGVRSEDGRLLACGAWEPLPSGAAGLLGVTVRASARRSGLGRAVSARLTRVALAAAPVATLGAYSDNAAALRTYERLGYGDVHLWASRRLPRGRAGSGS
jgi:GNAT superfamily N-acetyltransferase